MAACEVFLVLIGPNWLRAKDANGCPRIDDPDDLTTIEIATALARGIRVIPVLIDGASMPRAEELPDSLKALARRNAVEVRNTQFGRDVGVVTRKIRNVLKADPPSGLRIFAAAGAVMLLLAGWTGLFEMGVPLWVPFAAPQTSRDDADWSLAKTADTYDDYLTYLNAHPQGRYVVEARRAAAEVRPIAGALMEEPPPRTLAPGATALVDDHSCKRGEIKVVTGGNTGNYIPRTRKCVPRDQIP
jgi:hypothetical protein